MKHHADLILTGACQYNIGTYVKRFPSVFYGMMGEKAGEAEVKKLDSLVESALDYACKTGYTPEIHVLFSKNELTYERQIKDLIVKLESCRFPTVLIEETFDDHNDVGKYFGPYLKKILVKL